MSYYKPSTKTALIQWLKQYYPDGRFSVMEKKQLWALYYVVIRRFENESIPRN